MGLDALSTVRKHSAVFSMPPTHVPTHVPLGLMVGGPILGNGDLRCLERRSAKTTVLDL